MQSFYSGICRSMNYFLLAFLVLLIFEIALCTIQKYAKQPYLGKLSQSNIDNIRLRILSIERIPKYLF